MSIERNLIWPIVATMSVVGTPACTMSPSQPDAVADGDAARSTILLVSRSDGSIVRQTIELDADICIKALNATTTTCLTQGEPVVNNRGVVVGHEMTTETIELQGLN